MIEQKRGKYFTSDGMKFHSLEAAELHEDIRTAANIFIRDKAMKGSSTTSLREEYEDQQIGRTAR